MFYVYCGDCIYFGCCGVVVCVCLVYIIVSLLLVWWGVNGIVKFMFYGFGWVIVYLIWEWFIVGWWSCCVVVVIFKMLGGVLLLCSIFFDYLWLWRVWVWFFFKILELVVSIVFVDVFIVFWVVDLLGGGGCVGIVVKLGIFFIKWVVWSCFRVGERIVVFFFI